MVGEQTSGTFNFDLKLESLAILSSSVSVDSSSISISSHEINSSMANFGVSIKF